VFQLDTERLLIRTWKPDDRPAFAALTHDPEIMKYVHGGRPYEEREIDEFLGRQARHLEQYGVQIGVIVEKAGDRIVGIAGAQPATAAGDYEIGWWLAREVWGRGYASEAGGAAMRHVLEVVGRPRVIAVIDPENEASKKVALRLGMQHFMRGTGAEFGYRIAEPTFDVYERKAQ
jgi:RimJ/RimL family protein N-acetyltransferase